MYFGGMKNKVALGLVTAMAAVGFYAFSTQAYAKSPKFTKQEICEALADGKYDNNNLCVDAKKSRLEDIVKSLTTIETVTTFKIIDTPEEEKDITKGTSLALCPANDKKAYLLTDEHVLSSDGLKLRIPYGVVIIPAEKISETTFMISSGEKKIPVERLYINHNDDIGLLGVDSQYKSELKCFPYKIGDSSKLEVGNFVYIVGNPLNTGPNVREGIVSSLEAPSIVAQADVVIENAFMISNGLSPGDSGAPVIAIKDGEYELVGFAQGTFVTAQRMGWVIRVNTFIKKILPQLEGKSEFDALRNYLLHRGNPEEEKPVEKKIEDDMFFQSEIDIYRNM